MRTYNLDKIGSPENDAIARTLLPDFILTDIDRGPLVYAKYPADDLLTLHAFYEATHRELLAMLRESLDDMAGEMIDRVIGREYQTRAEYINIANELERRRTGVAPRARTLN